MEKAQFRGYVLEEVLSYLIRSSGYSLITRCPTNDPDLSDGHNGLNIRGRGTNHQIDVLGELNWIPAFNFPIRLIVEAKFHKNTIGVDIIREQVGLLADINQNYFSSQSSSPKARYRYVSVVFSTSGFTQPAVDMAVAHQIQLVDLGSDEYIQLKNQINIFTDAIFGSQSDLNKTDVKIVRDLLRSKFFRLNDAQGVSPYDQACESLLRGIDSNYDKVFIGMSKGGFMLFLMANDSQQFLNYSKNHPNHRININRSLGDSGKIRTISPIVDSDDARYSLSFKLPSALYKWIFEVSEEQIPRALNQKNTHFPKISIYYSDKNDNKDYIFNLEYNGNQ